MEIKAHQQMKDEADAQQRAEQQKKQQQQQQIFQEQQLMKQQQSIEIKRQQETRYSFSDFPVWHLEHSRAFWSTCSALEYSEVL